MKILIFTFCNHQKLKYNYNKNPIYESKNEKKKEKEKNYMSNVNLTWQVPVQYFSSKNEFNKT